MKDGFHTQDGLFFKKNEDSSVTISKYKTGHIDADIVFEQTLNSDTWESTISSMSKLGEGATPKFDRSIQFAEWIRKNRWRPDEEAKGWLRTPPGKAIPIETKSSAQLCDLFIQNYKP